MHFRLTSAILAGWLLVAASAAAQEAGAAAAAAPAPSEAAATALWCASAFAVAGDRARSAGDSTTADTYAASSAATFGIAAAELITNGMTVDQFRALAEKTALEVTAPFRTASHTEAECEAVAAEAPAADAPATAPAQPN